MSATTDQDELAPSQTPGYKVGEKKTMDEYVTMDASDESLKRWKASLGLASNKPATTDDDRKVIILHLALEVPGRPDEILDLSSKDALEKVKDKPFIIKEGVEYQMKVKFRIQHEVVCGLKYIQVVKRRGIKVDKTEEMIGSYGPSEDPYEKKFMIEEAPSGLLARGHYEAKSKFIDDDGFTHCEWNWSFDIKKDWD
ncbi:E set domain-containing protein [Gigaspora margarita]|uniref:Rho GDP-dissociation inhibitor n=1 Tax=Gigaspora margarita TaxID=4874 RepID=A0A8H4AWP2_GIGMA|nr:E set domain-containing protein [Gigaspora margarita]